MIRWLTGDCRQTLAALGPGSVHACITSPPYYSLRSYGTTDLVWADGWVGSLGLEPTPELFVEHIVECFRAVRRVLRDDGTLWVNMGDSYAGSGKGPSNNLNKGNPHAHEAAEAMRGMNRLTDTPTAWIPVANGYKAKDLMEIPSMVAQALRAPYVVPGCVKNEIDRAWLAAMFDGEGTIGIRRYQSYREEKRQMYQDGFVVYTSVANSDVELLDHCVAITGLGRPAIKDRERAGMVDPRGIVSRRDNYGWRQDGNGAVDIIRAVYPYLIAKRRQAMLAYTLDLVNKTPRSERGNGPVSPEIQAKKVLLHDLIKRCNQREDSIDLPSWVQEPKPEIEPGWYLRSRIPWLKRNAMPESVTDRPASSVEYVFLLSKSARYYWDADAVRVPNAEPKGNGGWQAAIRDGDYERYKGKYLSNKTQGGSGGSKFVRGERALGVGRNRRNGDWFFESWQGLLLDEDDAPVALVVNPAPLKIAHYASFPPKLVEPMVKASSRAGDVILDPFAGAGTTLMVADRLGRNAIGCELSAGYTEMGAGRVIGDAPMFVDLEIA